MIIFLNVLQFIFRIVFFLPVNISLAVMRGGGWLTQAIAQLTPVKKTVAKNIKMVLPDSPAEELAGKLIRNTGYAIFEMLCFPFFSARHFQKVLIWQDDSRIKEALGQGRGAILLTMHAGNYELASVAIAQRGYPITSILRSTDDPIFKILNRSRTVGGVKLINVAGEDMYREALKVLNRNEMIGVTVDTGALEGRHEFIDFLGKKVPVATGWLTLAQRSGAPVIPLVVKKDGSKNTMIIFEPTRVTRENRDQVVRDISRTFENYIREHPEQWLIFLNEYETKRMVEGK